MQIRAVTKVFAHRGASLRAPENTMPAFELAAELGADGIELDVQLTADGHVVCIHDETLDRTTTGSGPVGKATLAEIQRLDASGGNRRFDGVGIPLLGDVLALASTTGLLVNIELKNSIVPYLGLESAVVDLIADAHMADRVLLSTFNHISGRELALSGQPSPVGLLFTDVLADPWNYAASLGMQALHPNWEYIAAFPDTVEQCHNLSQAVNVWTVDDAATLRYLSHLRVDAIITNDPAHAMAVLA